MQYIKTVTGDEVLTLEEVKLYMRVSHSSDDVQITNIIKRVRQLAEEYLSRSLVEQDILLYIESSAKDDILLPFPNHVSVTSVLINGVESISSTEVKGLTQLKAKGVGVGNEVKILYSTSAVFEDGIKLAMLKEILNQYQNKDSYYLQNMASISDRFKGLLAPYIKMSF